jgi:hypothetical protein
MVDGLAAETGRLTSGRPSPQAYAGRATVAGVIKTAERIDQVHKLLVAVPAPPNGADLKQEWQRLVAKATSDVQRARAEFGLPPA